MAIESVALESRQAPTGELSDGQVHDGMTIGVLVTRESAALSLLTGANHPMGLGPPHPLEVTRPVAVLHLGCQDENGSNPLMTQLLEGRVGQKVLRKGVSDQREICQK